VSEGPASPRVALTFDAEHPDRERCRAGLQEEMVKLLDDLGVRGTFFIQGRWAEAYPGTARAIADAGHLIGNHSFYHARMPLLTDAGLRTDVGAAERVIANVTGVDPAPWFRCPFDAGADDPRVLDALAGLGYRNVGWNVEPKEWDVGRTGPMVERFVLDAVQGRGGGAVVLLHTWSDPALEALPGIVGGLRARGAVLVTVADLDGPAPGEPS
jgi:peptidoglycan/xylan/chitin deacetylase (PgdA/CDA1 family)